MKYKKWTLIGACLAGLLVIYLSQRFDYTGLFVADSTRYPNLSFVLNRVVRLVLNDTICLVLIREFFADSRFTRIGLKVFFVELFVLLPLYLTVKLYTEGPTEISSPLLSPIHRMIVNPLLMIILMVGFYYQKIRYKP